MTQNTQNTQNKCGNGDSKQCVENANDNLSVDHAEFTSENVSAFVDKESV